MKGHFKMRRRTFIASATAFVALPSAVLAGVGSAYRPGLVNEELAAGKTVFVDFYTDWCTTCRSQEKTVRSLLQENPAYEQAISFVAVDWDVHANSELARRLNIPRRSTLVALKGNQELGRIVAGTRKADIQALMEAALSAATS